MLLAIRKETERERVLCTLRRNGVRDRAFLIGFGTRVSVSVCAFVAQSVCV